MPTEFSKKRKRLSAKPVSDYFMSVYDITEQALNCFDSAHVAYEDKQKCESEQQAVVRILKIAFVQEEYCDYNNCQYNIIIENMAD